MLSRPPSFILPLTVNHWPVAAAGVAFGLVSPVGGQLISCLTFSLFHATSLIFLRLMISNYSTTRHLVTQVVLFTTSSSYFIISACPLATQATQFVFDVILII